MIRTQPHIAPTSSFDNTSQTGENESATIGLPPSLNFALANNHERRHLTVYFGKLNGTQQSGLQIASALKTSQRKNLTIKPAGTSENPTQVVSFETHLDAKNGDLRDMLVVLHVSMTGEALRCELKNPRTLFPRVHGHFSQRNPYHAASSAESKVDVVALRKHWTDQQNQVRQHYADQGLIRKDYAQDPLYVPESVKQAMFSQPIEPLSRAGYKDKDEILQESEWLTGEAFMKSLFSGTKSFGNNLNCPNLRWLDVPQHFKELGDNFQAPSLVRLDLYTKRAFQSAWAPPAEPQGGELQRLGDNFHAPSLQQLNLAFQRNFVEFGQHFHAPHLTGLSLRGATSFSAFPDDVRFPILVTLDLVNATNFREFPADFFDRVPNLRSLELRGTGVRYRSLPQHIRDNRDIHIDIRPVGEGNERIGGQQTTHQQSIHFSSSESAKRILAKTPKVDLALEFDKLRDHVGSLLPTPIPEGLQPHLQATLDDRVKYVLTLDKDHPHRQYFSSPVEAAKRVFQGHPMYLQAVDPASKIGVKDYLSACWRVARDPENRHQEVTDETTQEKFVQALYEIQRGYNLKGDDDDLRDDGDPRDLNICPGGAFNKITNIMSEILQDAETIYITDDVIKLRTAALIKNTVLEMLEGGALQVSNDLTAPDEEGAIFCTEATAHKLTNNLLAELKNEFNLPGQSTSDAQKRAVKISGFLNYQLTTTDLRDTLKIFKGKGKAAAP